MEKKTKSAISVFRKIIGPGKTEHSGRGFYCMDTMMPREEMVARAKAFAEKHPDKVESFVEKDKKDGACLLTLTKAYGMPSCASKEVYYRTLFIGKETTINFWRGVIVPM